MSVREYLTNKGRIVVKIGSSSLTHETGRLNLGKIDKLARQLANLRNQGKDVVLVSSGAIAVGTAHIGLKNRPTLTEQKQAVAAVGQAVLMQIYQKIFGEYNQTVAQVLLTKDIIENNIRKKNATNTFNALFEMGIIPIVNENDTVAVDEIMEEIVFGDNDTLSAIVSEIIEADLLILLSDIDGLYTADPRKNTNAKFISEVNEITPEIEKLAGDKGTSLGTGGMITKISAAKIAMNNGIDMIIANAKDITVLEKILEGKQMGTLFKSNT